MAAARTRTRAKAAPKPAKPVVTSTANTFAIRHALLGVQPGALVRIDDRRIARVAWHWMFRGEPVATEVRWWLSPSNGWSEPAEVAGGVLVEVIAAPGHDAGGPVADVDPLLRAIAHAPLFVERDEPA